MIWRYVMLLETSKSGFKDHVGVEVTGKASPVGCDGQSSSLWFKETNRSEPGGGRGSTERNTKAAFCFVLSLCLSLSSLIIFAVWKCVFAGSVHWTSYKLYGNQKHAAQECHSYLYNVFLTVWATSIPIWWLPFVYIFI